VKDALDAILHADQARYLEGIEPPRGEMLARMEARAAAERMPISDPEVASFLSALVRAQRPASIVEIGTNIGYGAIVMAEAAGPGARVRTVELRPATADLARAYVEEAGLASRIEVVTMEAVAFLDTLAGPVDLAYLDCVKEDYPAYLDRLIPHMRQGSVVVADNALWKGLVARDDVPADERARVAALREFNRRIVSPPFRGVILPLGDGVAFGTLVSEAHGARRRFRVDMVSIRGDAHGVISGSMVDGHHVRREQRWTSRCRGGAWRSRLSRSG
jgi:caffeoyl-CoA O-methyltransferase